MFLRFKKFNFKEYISVIISIFVSFIFVFFTVYGASTISSNISTDGTLSVTGVSTFTGGFVSQASSTAVSNLNVRGALNASSTLTVTGLSTFFGGFITASSTATSTFSVGGALTASSTFQSTGAVRLYSTLRADDVSTLAGFISTASSTAVDTLRVSGALTASTSISVGTGNNASVIAGMVAGFCTIPSTSITASSTGMATLAASCTGATGIISGDRIFLMATSSLVENNFVILSASSTTNGQIQVMIGETATSTSGTLSTGIHSFNFWAVR